MLQAPTISNFGSTNIRSRWMSTPREIFCFLLSYLLVEIMSCTFITAASIALSRHSSFLQQFIFGPKYQVPFPRSIPVDTRYSIAAIQCQNNLATQPLSARLLSRPELESKAEFVSKVREVVRSFPRPVVVVLRYLFAFLNQ